MYKIFLMILFMSLFFLYAQEGTEGDLLDDDVKEPSEQTQGDLLDESDEPSEQAQGDLLDESDEPDQPEEQAQVYYDDASAVKSILDANKLSWDINSIATFKNGRVVSLNLNNPDVGQDGINTLPMSVGRLNALEVLTINDNELPQLPKEITNCTKLTRLEIQNNSLQSLPPGISKLVNLRVLDLRNNQLDALPREIGRLRSLQKLQVWGNNFVTLPDEIGNLSALRELYLKGNRIKKLPVSITRLKIKYIDVIDNQLCGITGPVDKWLKKFDEKYAGLQKCVGEKRFK